MDSSVGEKRSRSNDYDDLNFDDQFEDDGGEFSKSCGKSTSSLTCNAEKGDEVCGQTPINMSIHSHFGEKVCMMCMRSGDNGPNSDYGMVSKTNAMKEYLISSELLDTLKFKKVLNPTNKNYAPLKLFLRKQVRELALTRFDNDPQKLEEERNKRELKKYERNVVKMDSVLSEQAEEFRNAMDEKSGVALEALDTETSEQATIAITEASTSTWKAKKVFNKVKSPKLKDMIKCIRG